MELKTWEIYSKMRAHSHSKYEGTYRKAEVPIPFPHIPMNEHRQYLVKAQFVSVTLLDT